MTVVVSGMGRFSDALGRMAARAEAANTAALMQAAALVERRIKEQIRGGHPKGTKTGATVGGPPQNITGTLRRSVMVQGPEPTGDGGWRAMVGPTVIYGRHVELGGPRWPAGVTYPYVQPGVESARGEVEGIAVRAWSAAIRG